MPSRPIALAADHAGFALKTLLLKEIEEAGEAALDLGTNSADSVDYPDYARRVADAIAGGRAERGVLVCGSGIGMSIAANRHPAIRAALVHSEEEARLARQHNDANVLVFGGRFIAPDLARACLHAFLTTPFEGGRHARRVAKLA